MKVALISTHTHPAALGLRYISSALKTAGHDVEMIFLTAKRSTSKADFSPQMMAALQDLVRDRDVVGLSLTTNTFDRACALTEGLREDGLSMPVVWGGTHPTVAPEECLRIADAVCIGEGERSTVDLLDRMERGVDPTDVSGMQFRAGGAFGNRQEVRNQVGPLERDLDSLPWPDYDLDTHWVARSDTFVRAKPEYLHGTLQRLRVLSTRGCPNRCTFCNNTAWREIYRGKGPWVRLRSVESVVDEIEALRARFSTITEVNIVDDLFFVRRERELEEFVQHYRQRVNLPLELDAFPNTVTEEKLRILTRVPIRLVSLGIESASARTLAEIYDRHTPVEQIAECLRLLDQYDVPTEVHYIVSNPFEPDEQVVETMRFVATHHRHAAKLRIFPLLFYPGSPLCDRAKAEGIIEERDARCYKYTYGGKLQFAGHDYLGIWLRIVLHLRNAGLPSSLAHRIVGFVTNRKVRRVLDRPWFIPAAFGTYQVGRKLWRVFFYQPFVRPVQKLRAWRVRKRERASGTLAPA